MQHSEDSEDIHTASGSAGANVVSAGVHFCKGGFRSGWVWKSGFWRMKKRKKKQGRGTLPLYTLFEGIRKESALIYGLRVSVCVALWVTFPLRRIFSFLAPHHRVRDRGTIHSRNRASLSFCPKKNRDDLKARHLIQFSHSSHHPSPSSPPHSQKAAQSAEPRKQVRITGQDNRNRTTGRCKRIQAPNTYPNMRMWLEDRRDIHAHQKAL